MTELSPAALAVWEAFNQEEAGVFVDYGDKLAAALRAAADQIPYLTKNYSSYDINAQDGREEVRGFLLTIATELEAS